MKIVMRRGNTIRAVSFDLKTVLQKIMCVNVLCFFEIAPT